MLIITGASFLFMLLLTAALSVPHKAFGYRRADLLTALTYGALVGLCFAADPLHDTVGKQDLYVGLPAIAALLVYAGLKLEAATQHVVISIIAMPVIAAFIAPTLCIFALAADATDYRPPKPPPRLVVKAVHALARKPKQRRA